MNRFQGFEKPLLKENLHFTRCEGCEGGNFGEKAFVRNASKALDASECVVQ